MLEEPSSQTLDRQLTTDIVAAYVRRNQIGSDELATPDLDRTSRAL